MRGWRHITEANRLNHNIITETISIGYKLLLRDASQLLERSLPIARRFSKKRTIAIQDNTRNHAISVTI